MTRDDARRRPRALRVLARLGWAGFLFFLVKGLLWLTVPLALVAVESLDH